MRVVYLNPSGQMGGAEVALLNILASIREAEPDWELDLIVSEEGPFAAKARAIGVSTSILRFPRSMARIGDASTVGPAASGASRLVLLFRLLWATPAIALYTTRLHRLLLRLDPEVIHTNGLKMHVLGALAKPSRIPLVWHIHDYVSRRPFMARLIRMFRRRCSLVLVNSNSVGLDIKSVCGDEVPVQTLYNGVDTDLFAPEGPTLDLDSLSGLAAQEGAVVRVGLLGTLARWKGHEIFLRALSLIPSHVCWRAYVIGAALYQTDGSQCSIEELREFAKELGISESVGFTGFVDEPASAIRSLDILVHASTQPEPFGLVIVEGMACGRTVIASNAGGAAEIFDFDVNAISFPPGDAERLAQQITWLATDSEQRRKLGTAGRKTIEDRFSQGRLAKELAPIYNAITRHANY